MLRFLLDYIKDGIAMYSYMPDGDALRVGHVGMEIDTGKRIIAELAPGDDCRSYAFMMMKRIGKFRKEGHFEESGLVAWC